MSTFYIICLIGAAAHTLGFFVWNHRHPDKAELSLRTGIPLSWIILSILFILCPILNFLVCLFGQWWFWEDIAPNIVFFKGTEK